MKTNLLLWIRLGGFAVAVHLNALAAAATSPAPSAAAPKPAAPAYDPQKQYRLTSGDRITVSVTGQTALGRTATLPPAGTFSLALIDTPAKLSGLTVAQAEDAIEKAYIDNQLLRRPQVLVTVEQTTAQYVYVTGETTKKEPILYPTDTGRLMTLFDVIQKAGSTGEARLSSVKVYRKKEDGTIQELGPFDMDSYMKGRTKSPQINIDILPGDTVEIPMRIM